MDAESAFEAWKKCSAGRPCDYTGLTYDRLRGTSGVQWPCNAEHPDGTERLYTDGRFFAAPDYCESYGKDLVTGAPVEPTEYRALNPDARAIIKAADYLPPHEEPGKDYPFALITGRTLYHFHTRTKTGRTPQLNAAALVGGTLTAGRTTTGNRGRGRARGLVPPWHHPRTGPDYRYPARCAVRPIPLRLLGQRSYCSG